MLVSTKLVNDNR